MLYEGGNVQGKEPTIEILTSGVRDLSECHKSIIANTVSQSCVSQGKVGCKCNNSLYQTKVQNSNTRETKNVGAGELKESKNEEDRTKPHYVYRSGSKVVHAVEAPSQLATDVVPKREALSSRKPSLLSRLTSP